MKIYLAKDTAPTPPPRATKMSSTRGSGYLSTFRAGFSVTLKSPHSRTDPSGLGTTTMGVAQLLHVTGVMIPSFPSVSVRLQLLFLNCREKAVPSEILHGFASFLRER